MMADGYKVVIDWDAIDGVRKAVFAVLADAADQTECVRQSITHRELAARVSARLGRTVTEGSVTRRARELRQPEHGGHIVECELGEIRLIPAGSPRWRAHKDAQRHNARHPDPQTQALAELAEWRRKWAATLGADECDDIAQYARRIAFKAAQRQPDPNQTSIYDHAV